MNCPKTGGTLHGFFNGSITSSALTNSSGVAYAYFKACSTGTATITANTNNGLSATTNVTATPPSNIGISIVAYSYSSSPTSKEYELDIDVKSNGVSCSVYQPSIQVTTDFGTLRPSGQNPPGVPGTITMTGDACGGASAIIRSDSNGLATVVVNSLGSTSTITINFHIGDLPGPSGPFKTLPSATDPLSSGYRSNQIDWSHNFLAYKTNGCCNVDTYSTNTSSNSFTFLRTLGHPNQSNPVSALAFSNDGTKLV